MRRPEISEHLLVFMSFYNIDASVSYLVVFFADMLATFEIDMSKSAYKT